ncbi:MAG: hypothetical protein ACUVSY_14390 [Roseiflexus sp.]
MAYLIRNTRQRAAPYAFVRHLVVCQHNGRFDSVIPELHRSWRYPFRTRLMAAISLILIAIFK